MSCESKNFLTTIAVHDLRSAADFARWGRWQHEHSQIRCPLSMSKLSPWGTAHTKIPLWSGYRGAPFGMFSPTGLRSCKIWLRASAVIWAHSGRIMSDWGLGLLLTSTFGYSGRGMTITSDAWWP